MRVKSDAQPLVVGTSQCLVQKDPRSSHRRLVADPKGREQLCLAVGHEPCPANEKLSRARYEHRLKLLVGLHMQTKV